jgi:hypothetical protein
MFFQAETDQNGQFEFHNLCAGPVEVGAIYKGVANFSLAQAGDINVIVQINVH